MLNVFKSKYVEPQQQIEKPSDPDMDAWSKNNPWFIYQKCYKLRDKLLVIRFNHKQ